MSLCGRKESEKGKPSRREGRIVELDESVEEESESQRCWRGRRIWLVVVVVGWKGGGREQKGKERAEGWEKRTWCERVVDEGREEANLEVSLDASRFEGKKNAFFLQSFFIIAGEGPREDHQVIKKGLQHRCSENH